MLSRYYKLIFLLLLGIAHAPVFAQNNLQNLLDQMPDTSHGGTPYWIEQGDYYYFISVQRPYPVNYALHGWASRYYINKYDKNTLQRLDQKYIAGDTTRTDSVVFTPYLGLKNNQFYIFYLSQAQHGDTVSPFYYFYQRLDINFNTLAPERRIEDSSKINALSSDCIKPMDNGILFVGYYPRHSPPTNYMLIDSMGNNIKMGGTGYDPTQTGYMRGFTLLGNHKYLVSGYSFAGEGHPPYNFGWCLVNDSIQMLDTFKDKYGLVQDPVALSYFQLPSTILLPGGNLITAGGTAYVEGSFGYDNDYPLIRKHNAATRYSIDKMFVSGPLDNTDTLHATSMPVSVIYNPYDHHIYYASSTHHVFPGSCAANSDKGYLEVISLDTNLNLRWKKYFKSSGFCSTAKGVNVPDGRGGIIITGYDFYYGDNIVDTKHWTYYITDATLSDSLPTAVNELSITAQDFKIYPNPAHDIVQISVENSTLRSIAICDITGRALLNRSLSKAEESIDISTLAKGIYILRCEDKEGHVFVSKVVKE